MTDSIILTPEQVDALEESLAHYPTWLSSHEIIDVAHATQLHLLATIRAAWAENVELREALEKMKELLVVAGLDSSSTNQWAQLRMEMWECLEAALSGSKTS